MALRDEKLAFIGCGTMGEAMVKGLLRDHLVEADQIVVSHPRPDRLRELEERYQVSGSTSNSTAARGATIVALTVKPQVLDEVVADLEGQLEPATLVLTIVAGARMATVLLVMAVPILDVAWLIFVRWRAKTGMGTGDRRHLHYRLLERGWSQRQVVVAQRLT